MGFHMIKIFAVLSILGTVVYGNAQDTPRIEYGETVSGEITNQEFQILYDFEGNVGDIIIIEMQAVELFGDLETPEIILLDEQGYIVADTRQGFPISGALLALELPNNGLYTILASRAALRAEENIGEFNLTLSHATELIIGEPIQGIVRYSLVSDTEGTLYYVIQGDNVEPLTLSYDKVSGDYGPEIAINRINEDYVLQPVAVLSGDELSSGTITLPSSDDILIVSLGRSLFSFNFEVVTAEYELMLTSE